ncbi:hypothetical protein HPP92_017332 [Vanilla planifolia]|uniref:Uncharacterized protein n=1 Tax=Vanilla planifolia TaxID=51239 RepID=A0A835Q936_VANPL|nr:hypothetical protein HPP92_017332 [Vanilla planifolia]
MRRSIVLAVSMAGTFFTQQARFRTFIPEGKLAMPRNVNLRRQDRSKTSENIPYLSANAIWDEVNRKLLDSLYTTGIDMDDQNVDFIESKAYALSIFALSKVVSQVLQRVVSPTCIKWLEEEFFLDDTSCNMLSKKLMGNDVILNNVKRLGKSELYADLLFFLRFDAVRSECCYDSRFIGKHGVEILEDLVISLADAIACIYLELISVDSGISSEMNTLGLKICPLSTRSLQRLRNEVLLKQWLQQNFESVISLYEDRFELLVLSREKLDDMAKSQSKSSIWQKLIFRRQWTASRSIMLGSSQFP